MGWGQQQVRSASRVNWVCGALLAVAVGAVATAARADAVGGESGPPGLALRIEPARLELGSDSGAKVIVELRGDLEAPVITTNVGRIEGVSESAPGVWAATYIPPEAAYPQLAVVSAAAAGPGGEGHAWTIVPLWGRGIAEARTKPQAMTSVKILDQSFGPVRADKSGLARIPVLVPPGVANAYDGDRPIDLGIPKSSCVHAVLARGRLSAAVTEEVRVRIYAVTPQGQPRTDAALGLTTVRGETGDAIAVAPGVYEVIWTLPPRLAGEERLEVRIVDEPESVAAVTAGSVSGLPTRVAVSVDQEELVAAPGLVLTAEVRVEDAGGNLVAAPIAVAASFGEVAATTESEPGVYGTTLTVPAAFAGNNQIEIRAVVREGAFPEAGTSVRLRPAAPAAVSLAADRDTLVANGDDGLPIRFDVTDQYGNRITDATPTLTTSAGVLKEARAAADGHLVAEYSSPRQLFAGEAVIEAAIPGGAHDRLALSLLPAPAAVAIGAKAGLQTNFVGVAAPYVAVEGGYWTELLGQQLGAIVEVGWSIALSGALASLSSGDVSVGADSQLFAFTGAVGWRHDLTGDWQLWLDGGGGVTIASAKISVAGQPDQGATKVLPVLQLSGSAGMRLWRGFVFGELRFRYQGDPGGGTLRGDLAALTVDVGYRLSVF